MTKFLAAAHDPDSLLARRARQKRDGDDDAAPHVADPRQEPKPPSADPAADADMLDLINKFEQNYAELAPVREEPQSGALTDDLFPEFPEPFESSPPPPRNRARTLELARFEPQGAREAPRAQAARAEVPPAVVDEQVEIDEAFSILKAAEAKGAEKAQRAADDAQALAAERQLARSDVQPEFRPERAESPAPTERVDWAARSHRPRTIAVVAGVLVLALGLTVGFIAGRTPHGKPQATIQTTEQGGTQLRLDRELRKR